VGRRLISDVPLRAFLSGGVDSSTIVGLMAAEVDQPAQTFTIGFDDRDGFDERPYAKLVAERHGMMALISGISGQARRVRGEGLSG